MLGRVYRRRRLISQPHTDSLKFYQDKKPKIEWEVMLTVGVIRAFSGGSLMAA